MLVNIDPDSFFLCVCVCVCVYVRERERERERLLFKKTNDI
jgi:hypothetical protein